MMDYDWWDKAQKLGFYDELMRMHTAIDAEFRRETDERWAEMLAAETPAQKEQRIARATTWGDSMRAAANILKEFYSG